MNDKAILLGDLHVGSVFAPWPPDYTTKQGLTVRLNPMQRRLWRYWLAAVEEIRSLNPKWMGIMGDVVDGIQRGEAGRTLVSADLDDQMGAALHMLRMLPTRRIYFVVGTDYHEAKYNQLHYLICLQLTGDKHYWLDTMGLIIHGDYRINLAHGSSAAFVFPETVQARERGFMLAAAELRKIRGPVDLIARGHLHIYNMLEISGFRIRRYAGLKLPAVTSIKTLICPAFQGQTAYMRKKSPFKLIPDIGYILLDLDDHGVHVHERIFEHLALREAERRIG